MCVHRQDEWHAGPLSNGGSARSRILRSSAFRVFSLPIRDVSRSAAHIFAIGFSALPTWEQKNEAAQSGSRRIDSIDSIEPPNQGVSRWVIRERDILLVAKTKTGISLPMVKSADWPASRVVRRKVAELAPTRSTQRRKVRNKWTRLSRRLGNGADDPGPGRRGRDDTDRVRPDACRRAREVDVNRADGRPRARRRDELRQSPGEKSNRAECRVERRIAQNQDIENKRSVLRPVAYGFRDSVKSPPPAYATIGLTDPHDMPVAPAVRERKPPVCGCLAGTGCRVGFFERSKRGGIVRRHRDAA